MMQISSTKYLPEFGMEDPTFFDHEYPIPMDSFAFQFDDVDHFKSFSASPKSYSSSHKRLDSESTQNSSFPVGSPDQSVASTRPTKQLKTWNAYSSDPTMNIPKNSSSSSSSKIISFEHSNTSSVTSQLFNNMDAKVKPKTKIGHRENLNFAAGISQVDNFDNKSFLYHDKGDHKAATATIRNPNQARDHVIAERKRREKLSQRFIALSAILPGLKKNDKATILEDAIKYLKRLQERAKTLEEQAAERKVESAVFVKRSTLFANDENSNLSIPEIEARVSGKDVLFRIHCDKHSGRAATTILSELEQHHLTVQSSTVLPFGNNTLDITIVAQMNKEYGLTPKDLIRNLSQALRQLI